MNHYLYRGNSGFPIQSILLSLFLGLARQFQWKPAGTLWNPNRLEPPSFDPPPWDGCYVCKEHQVVSVSDARNLAFALERALLVDEQSISQWAALMECVCVNYEEDDKGGTFVWIDDLLVYPPFQTNLRDMENLAMSLRMLGCEERRSLLRKFISFCRAGPFCIA